MPRTQYAQTQDGMDIAYQAFGDGPALLLISSWISNIEVMWELPNYAEMLRQLASFATVIHFDKRGVGMSDKISGVPDLDARMEDVLAVLEATGTERATLFGVGDGAALAAFFAATFPERATSLIFYGVARVAWAPDYPWGMTREANDAEMLRLGEIFGDPAFADELVEMCFGDEDVPSDPAFGRWLTKVLRFSGTAKSVAAYADMLLDTDVRNVLPAIHVPTVVLTRDGGDQQVQEQAAYVAERIPTATTDTFMGGPWWGGPEDLVAKIASFLRSVQDEEAEFDRVLATVLFTDIVDSTATAAVMGDSKWREVVAGHDDLARAIVARYRGEFVRGTGDGMLATFDGPARAVRCAQSFCEAARSLGVEIRAGAHTGEITFGGNDLAGIGVHVAARVAAMAGPSEVWASSTVKDLTAGSGLTFEDAGEHELKGVPDRWHLYRVVGS